MICLCHKLYKLYFFYFNMLNKTKKEILLFLLMQAFGWGGFWFLRSNGVNYIDNYLLTVIYFVFVCSLFIYLFRDLIREDVFRPSKLQVLLFFLFYLISSIVYYVFSNYYNLPSLLAQFNSVYLLTLDFRYLLTKTFEIFFQQLTILILILLLHQKISLRKITYLFLIIFPLLHLVNYIYMPFLFASILFVGSILGALFFPYLILKVRDGFIYTYLLHWSFYLLVDIILIIKYLI